MNLLEGLTERLATGRVVVIAGAGVSIAATAGQKAASWQGLLDTGIDRCVEYAGQPARWAERMREDLGTDDVVSWLSVATQVHERLRGVAEGEFRSWLEDTIGQLEVTDAEVIEALRDLRVPIATTNYDNLLEDVTGWPPVTWRDPGRVQRVLQGDEQAVIHLHGHYKEPDSVVLGYRSYAEVLGDRAAQALQQALRGTVSLLYVGFGASFQDPNFSRWLAWASETFRGRETYRHYRLCREEERQAVEGEHSGDERIFAVPYGERHEDLAPFLRRLAPSAEREPEAVPATPTGLPPTDWLLGRDEELAELVDHLCGDSPAPVPILGGPGMGKTTLSVHAFRHPAVAARYGQRRYFVRCNGVTAAAALPGAIAAAMGVVITGDPTIAVIQALAAGASLLVLDNLETPWDLDRGAVEALLSELAATSVALVVSVRGLRRPHGVRWRATFEMGKLDPEAAEQLFEKITDQAHRGDADLGELLGILDGVPLAIRLMAHAAVAQPSLRWVLDAWNQTRTAILSRGEGKDDDLEVSIALSLDSPRLDDQGRRLASSLALLPDGLAFRDLDALFPEDGREAARGLAGAGLAFYDGERLHMLSPVREAIHRLAPAEESDLRTLVHHYLKLVQTLGEQIGFAGGREANARLEPEIGNLEVSFRLALENLDPDAAFAAGAGLSKLMRFNNIGSPGLFSDAARLARSLDRPTQEAACIQRLGHIALARWDHEGARARYEEAQPLFRRLGSVLGEATCIRRLGDIALERSDYQGARARYEEAQPLCHRVGDVLGEAACIRRLGDIALERSDPEGARARYEEAQPLFRRVGSMVGEANCIQRLGEIALERSDHEGALARSEEALSLYRRMGSVLGEAHCIQSLGDIALERSDHEGARARYEAAQPLFRRVGSVLGEANCIQGLGDITQETGDRTEAIERWIKALELYQRIPEPYSIGRTHERLAKAATEDDERERHAGGAREAWRSIDRLDLIERLDEELGTDGSR